MSGGRDLIRLFFLCEESLSLFPGADHASRFGGAGLQMYLLGQELARDPGFDVSFVFKGPIGGARHESIRLIERRPLIRRGKGLPILSRFVNEKRRREPYAGDGKKVVISTQALFAPELIEAAELAGAKSIFRVASETDTHAPRDASPGQRSLILSAIAAADRVVAQTESQRRTLLETTGKNSVVIRKGYPVPAVPPRHADKRGVLWVGSSQVLKQPWYFLDLACDFPDEIFTMVIPNGGVQVFDYVRRRAVEIPNLVLVDRQVPFDEVQGYFDRSRAFVYTSEFGTEPANTVVQAAAGACAILSHRLDPDGMFSEHGAGVCADGDYCKMRSLLGELLDDDGTAARLGARAFEYVSQEYSLLRAAEQYRELIRTMF